MNEAWPLMLSTLSNLGCLPDLKQPLNWLPLDLAADAVVEISFNESLSVKGASVFHVVNNSGTPGWSDLLSWIEEATIPRFEVVEPHVWLNKLNSLDDHPARKLLGLWESSFGKESSKYVKFSTERSESVAPSMRKILPLDETWAKKMWQWVEEMSNRVEAP